MRSQHPSELKPPNGLTSERQHSMQIEAPVAQPEAQPFLQAPAPVPEVYGQGSWSSKSLPATTLAAKANAAAIRALDILVSAVLLVVLAPIIVLAAIAIRLDSPGPAFFRVDRVGYRGSHLRMLKFRKMHDGASGSNLTTDDDHRFTRLGGSLSKLKIDEIPQLWNVLKGDMSLVGPRPEDQRFVAMHPDVYRTILSVRPGVTGLSQIAFAEESRILDDDNPVDHYVERILPQKVLLDEMFAENRSLWFNFRILFWTTAAVIMRRQVAVHRESGKMNLRRRKAVS
jgi:lipopolysaccharide/colanic/teichoic acid biosynthesis glycosyltransferase